MESGHISLTIAKQYPPLIHLSANNYSNIFLMKDDLRERSNQRPTEKTESVQLATKLLLGDAIKSIT